MNLFLAVNDFKSAIVTINYSFFIYSQFYNFF